MSMSLGVRRSLQQCAQADGTFAMLAMDQRGSLMRAINPDTPKSVTYPMVADIKRAVISVLSPHASATLLDVEYGYPTCVASGALSGRTGLLLAYEKSGYEGDPTARRTALLDNWSVGRAVASGASGVKLLVYYRPDAPNAAEQENLVSEVAEECQKAEVPLFLEPLHYSLDPASKTVPDAERRQVVVESARKLTSLGITVLKAEFPVDVKQNSDEDDWTAACAELSSASKVPWVLLSAGVDYDIYLRQVKVACSQGASGVLCGRAVWKESVQLAGEARTAFLENTAVGRFQEIAATVSRAARPFTDFYPATSGDDLEGWQLA
jgi:tagatose 1,6-diphosphate aldolase